MTDSKRDELTETVRASLSDRDGEKAFELIVDDWDRLRRTEVKPPVPIFYTAVDLADRAKELRERARKYRDGKFDDVAEAVEADAKMLDYAASLAAIRYDAKTIVGTVVYELEHLSGTMRDLTAGILQRANSAWVTLSNGEEN